MGTENNDPDDDKGTGGKTGGELGDEGKRAIDAERKARREAERRAADAERQLQELADKDKPELERLRSENATLKSERDDATSKLARYEVALAKGLNASQAKRLVGSTVEELEADADELLETFGNSSTGAKPAGGPPGRTPVPNLGNPRGGTDPAEEPVETDPAKLAASVPRM